jgi:hypothetical protein
MTLHFLISLIFFAGSVSELKPVDFLPYTIKVSFWLQDLATMLTYFRDRHPMGSIVTDLIRVEEGLFVVKVQVLVNNTVVATGLAGSTTVESAEDAALQRALTHAGFASAHLPPDKPSFAGALPLNPISPPLNPSVNSSVSHLSSIPTNGRGIRSEMGSPEPPLLREPSPAIEPEPEDLSDIIAQSDVELQRIGWSAKEGREFLESRFNKKSRHQLNESELRDFLRYLKQQPARSRQETPF